MSDKPEMVPVPVPVHFSGMVDVLVPASVPIHRRRALANKLATARILATLDNPDAPEASACDDYQADFGLEEATAEREWDGCLAERVSGQWSGPRDEPRKVAYEQREACDLEDGMVVLIDGTPVTISTVDIDNGKVFTVNVHTVQEGLFQFTEGDYLDVFVDTPEQAEKDRSITNLDYEPGVFRRYFTSPFDQYKERIGQAFTVLGRDEEAEAGLENHEDMYRIRFEDGTEITAWGHEVCVLNYENCS
jgi:hypothetical protein